MNKRRIFPLAAVCASLLATAPCMVGNVHAEEATEKNPLQFWSDANGSFAKLEIEADYGFFTQGNSWFGKAESYLGRSSHSWSEILIRPGFEFNYVLPGSSSFYGMLDAVQADTFGGMDAAASNYYTGDTTDFRIDHAYVGWKSGDLFKGVDKDFLDISFGRQTYLVGTGFLFGSEGGAGFNRAAYWTGGRKSAEYAGIVRLKTGNWSADLVYLKSDDIAKTDTKAGGGNIAYEVKDTVNVGAGFYMITSDIEDRDKMNVYNIRGGVNPFALANGAEIMKPLHFAGEFVHEDRDSDYSNGDAWFLSVDYTFEKCPLKPNLMYRYASFDADYDSLFYAESDWEQWYQGEILGEYALGNSNLDSHMIKLKIVPTDAVTVNLAYMKFYKHSVADGSPDALADEYNAIVDWTVNSHLTVSGVVGMANPNEAFVETVGGDKPWTYMMLFGSVKF